MKNKNKKGFTLMELVVVIAILAVLGLLLYPQVTKYLGAAKETTAVANARTAYTAALFESSTGDYKNVNKEAVQAYFTGNEATVTSASCSETGKCTVTVETSGVTATCDEDGKCAVAPAPTPGS